MLVSDITNIVGFKFGHIDKYPLGSTEEIYIYENYKLSVMKNLYEDNIYTLYTYEDKSHFTVLDMYGKNLSKKLTTLFLNISEKEAVQFLKEEFNSILRKHKIEKLNIKN